MRLVKLFYLFIIGSFVLLIHAPLLGLPTITKHEIGPFESDRDSISYHQIVKLSPKQIASNLGLPPTIKNKTYLRNLKREIKKTIKTYPELAQNKVAYTLLLKEIEESTLHSANKKALKSTLIIVGIILLGVLLLKGVAAAFEKSI